MIDRNALLERCGGDVPLAQELLQLFHAMASERLRELPRADAGDAERHAHALRGAAANIAADELAQAAARFERGARNDALDLADLLAAGERALADLPRVSRWLRGGVGD